MSLNNAFRSQCFKTVGSIFPFVSSFVLISCALFNSVTCAFANGPDRAANSVERARILLGTDSPAGFSVSSLPITDHDPNFKLLILNTKSTNPQIAKGPVNLKSLLASVSSQSGNRTLWLYETKLPKNEYDDIQFRDSAKLAAVTQKEFIDKISGDQLQITKLDWLMFGGKPNPCMHVRLHKEDGGERIGILSYLKYPDNRVVFLYAVYWGDPTAGIAETKQHLQSLVSTTKLNSGWISMAPKK